MPISFKYAARSNLGLGSKSRNEDSGYAGPSLLILADGMGGHAAGDVASSTVAGMVAKLDRDDIGADDAVDRLTAVVADANERLRAEMDADPSREGMGTTLIVLMKAGRQIAMANIGDSRAYQLRDGKFTQITKDHSFVQSLLDAGRITPEEAVHHPQRSLVTRVLTGREQDVPDVSLREARVGDRYLLCSDGLSDYVSRATIEEIFTSGRPIDDVADQLIDVALKGSTRDNVTVVVGEVIGTEDSAPNRRPDVVGAAMAHGTTQAVATREPTPAEKAMALQRELNTPEPQEFDDDDDINEDDERPFLAEQRPRRRGRFYGAIAAVVVLAVLAVAACAGWIWSQGQYYVKESGGRVAIYKGVDSSIGPIDLGHMDEKTDIPVADLPSFYRNQVKGGIDAKSHKDATRTVESLREQLAKCVMTSASGSECTK